MEITSIDHFVRYYENIRSRTDRVILCIPHELFEWRPARAVRATDAPAAFSFADMIRHLAAIERWMFAENVQGRPSLYPGHGPELARTPDEVLAYYARMHAEAIAIFRALRPEDLQRTCVTPGGASLAVWKWLRAMVEHEVHHRGQLYLMLNMCGVPTPPLYGLTSEEVRANSLSITTGEPA